MEKSGKTLLCLLLTLLLIAGVLGGCAKKPMPNTAVIRYKNQEAVLPMTIENVVMVKEYIVDDALYQVVVYEKDALTPVVFTSLEVVSYEIGDNVELLHYEGQVYHTYDPFLQQTKSELRKAFIREKYQEYFGREASEVEYNEALEKLIEKVQLKDLEVRLATAPEAVAYRISQANGKPLTSAQYKRIIRMLERGVPAERIVEVLT